MIVLTVKVSVNLDCFHLHCFHVVLIVLFRSGVPS